MSWIKETLYALNLNQTVKVRPLGHSMRGRIESGQLVTIQPTTYLNIQINDVVFIAWKRHFLLHLVKDIQQDQVLIANNLGKINGWAQGKDVLGKVIAIED